jgi:hypothetical protein
MKRAAITVVIFVVAAFLASCASTFTVFVGDDGAASLVYTDFQDCPGAEFVLTVTQIGPSGQPGKETQAVGHVAAGSVRFDGLKGINTSGLVKVTLTAKQNCGPFKSGVTYSTGDLGIVLPPVTDPNGKVIKDTFVVDVRKFK